MDILKKFIDGDYVLKQIDEEDMMYQLYIDVKKKLQNQGIKLLSYDEIISAIPQAYINEFNILMKEFDIDKLYSSHIHGIDHNIRVAIFALIISAFEKIDLDDFRIIIECAKYHDIGRINDLEDITHGFMGARKIDFLESKYNSRELSYMRTVITIHSLSDDSFNRIASLNDVDDIERCKKMFHILKDADGLDRARLEWPYIDIDYLRTFTAKRLIPFAYELNYNYEYNSK